MKLPLFTGENQASRTHRTMVRRPQGISLQLGCTGFVCFIKSMNMEWKTRYESGMNMAKPEQFANLNVIWGGETPNDSPFVRLVEVRGFLRFLTQTNYPR